MDFVGTALPLTQDQLSQAAADLNVPLDSLVAVLKVETGWSKPGDGFLPSKRPKILFEPHVFSRYSNHQFDAQYPTLSYPQWRPNGYGAGGEAQYVRLAAALGLDSRASLLACSWGLGQLMGFNYQACGFSSPQNMVAAMCVSEVDQLRAMVKLLDSFGLTDELREQRWTDFAKRYNGAGYAANSYDVKLAAAFAVGVRAVKWGDLPVTSAADPAADERHRKAGEIIIRIQVGMNLWGRGPLAVDGVMGEKTGQAIARFKSEYGMSPYDSLEAVATALGA